MRANIGFILIGLGLVGAYIVLGGKFAGIASAASSGSTQQPEQLNILTPDQAGTVNTGGIAPGGAYQPVNVPFIPQATNGAHETPKDPTTNSPIGSGGMSWQSRFTQLGHIVSIQPMDRNASRGGMR